MKRNQYLKAHNQAIKFILLLVVFQVSVQKSYSQIEMPAKEIGFRLVGLNSVDFVYKKERKPDKISRYRLMFSQAGLSPAGNNTYFSLNTGFAFGSERRKSLKNDSYFFSGWEPGFIINYNLNSGKGFGQVTGFLGYIVGFAHNFSDKLCLNFEVIPRLSATGSFGGAKSKLKYDAGFNSSNIGIGIYYRIM